MDDRTKRNIGVVARLVSEADGLLITAGAGMGVDSGLPDFRGREGFWRAYPALARRQISFEKMANPHWFLAEPEMAWAFYGHRQNLYRRTTPHMGFQMLRDWGRATRGGCFVVTSNVDEQFEKAGFPRENVFAVHGTIFSRQCTKPCRAVTWRAPADDIDIDLESMRARGELPQCPHCGQVARPNVLMFGDGAWVSGDSDAQRSRYLQWLVPMRGKRLLILELGAGTAVATVRHMGEDLMARGLGTLVRINPDATAADEPAIPIRLGALAALREIESALSRLRERAG